MQSLVSSAFSSGKTYKVTNLEKENAIADAAGDTGRTALFSTLNDRFDAVIYGRVWWQIAPEDQGHYPQQFKALREWANIPYTVNILGQPTTQIKQVTTRMRDTLETVPYRSQKACLMLSLSIYRLDASGEVSKVVETYSVASQLACLANGSLSNTTSLIGIHDLSRTAEMLNDKKKSGSTKETSKNENKKSSGFFGALAGSALDAVKDATKETTDAFKESFKETKEAFKETAKAFKAIGSDNKNTSQETADVESKFSETQKTKTIPSSLQMKSEMAKSLVAELAKKLQPTDVVFEIPNKFSDKKLVNLLKDNAFLAGLNYSEFAFKQYLYNKYKTDEVQAIYDEKAKILDDVNIPEAYAKSSKRFKKAAENNLDYIYSSAICEEGLGHFKKALYSYRLAFEIEPKLETAMGISRCLFAMDMAERVKETNKEIKKAKKEASLK